MAHLLGSESLSIDFGTGKVLDDVTVGLEDGDRIGIVGANGAGKSTLMKALAGRQEPHSGRVTVSRGTRLGVLDQSDRVDPSLTVLAAIVGDADEHEWASDPRIRDVMSGLVPDLDADALVASLSGGQQRRVALAKVLVGDHDAVFLDEPTNHLDVDGVVWLAEHLKRRWGANRGALLVVTHDRWFLDEVTNRTWEVHDGIVESYEGGYAAYVLQRVERDRIAAATESKRQNLMRKELAWLRRGAPARTSKPKFRIDAANALIADVPPIRDSIQLHRMAASRLGKDVVNLVRAGVTYGSGAAAKEVLRSVEWNIGPGERTGILGENGAGKSTLLKLITGELEPTSGHVKRGVTVRVATLSQQLAELEDHAEERVSALVKQYSSITLSDGSEMTPTQLLERLGFTSVQLKTQVKRLSGGQRRRLQLLVVLLSEPNVLVLDEPTNDLDTDILAALEDLLDSWPGTLIVVSHDRYLMERVTDQQYAVVDGGLRHLPGGVDEYVALQRDRKSGSGGIGTFGPTEPSEPSKPSKPSKPSEPSDSLNQSQSRHAAGGADSRASTGASGPELVQSVLGESAPAPAGLSGAERRAVEKELTAVERRMGKITELTEGVHHEMLMHDQSDFAGLARLNKRIGELEEENAELEERWLELSERLG
ncbi:ABC-F family ATP-binding cassette domain-containing protein [Demequina capsici]|uniref:ABC-F family ATP-binding cassette domain-containing protein n=1 Tax=Demequina capsici TaxID=3075620 RepID=A0AA96F943_9MICO|nr:ABC-F family ATP-binding cassette domain-containing protein [Demequina sp. OYTSA14]WNM23990.1 ABC-F family ATP-binding cassette domain-containing protein [Demequina sp. OYTSA14]